MRGSKATYLYFCPSLFGWSVVGLAAVAGARMAGLRHKARHNFSDRDRIGSWALNWAKCERLAERFFSALSAGPRRSRELPCRLGECNMFLRNRFGCHLANACDERQASTIARRGTKEGSPGRRPCARHDEKLPCSALTTPRYVIGRSAMHVSPESICIRIKDAGHGL